MHLPLLLDMAVEAMGDRVAIVSGRSHVTYRELAGRAAAAAAFFATDKGERVVLVDTNSEAVPIALFGAAICGKPFVPVNYRLTDVQLRAILTRTAPALVIVGPGVAERIRDVDGLRLVARDEFLSAASNREPSPLVDLDPDAIAVLLYTSGTTGEPKAAVLRHSNLASYILATVELASADEDEAGLVSVPPYHIAGVSAVLSSTFSGRRMVYLDSFEPTAWVDAVDRERITHAMVVPTMLGRVLDAARAVGSDLPSLVGLSYGGGPMPSTVIRRAVEQLPHVGFVNAYGLTETSSTIAVLGPEDHRAALASHDPEVQRRLGSVGRAIDSIELTIRDFHGEPLPAGQRGEIWVRGPQVSGEYLGKGGLDDGWFNTRDAGELDAHGFLYVHGRLDDVIVRGGENLSPGEIETVLVEHPDVAEAAVVGIPDVEWGERVVASVVLKPDATASEAELRDWVRSRLRSTRTPERIDFRDELPSNETGKVLRRVLREELNKKFATGTTT
ncbi:MAG: AMP-dependent synthetase and ligase [Ilumatobacteraceae bacterium]|nr:AMP-dependent synthetase and ligase [Ilumatobacteraceae bacterium]